MNYSSFISLHVNKLILVHIFVDMEDVIVQYDIFHMFQHIYVYKQVLYHKVLDKDIVLIPMVMKQYDIKHQQHDHRVIVLKLIVHNY